METNFYAALDLWLGDHPGMIGTDIDAIAKAAGKTPEQLLIDQGYLDPAGRYDADGNPLQVTPTESDSTGGTEPSASKTTSSGPATGAEDRYVDWKDAQVMSDNFQGRRGSGYDPNAPAPAAAPAPAPASSGSGGGSTTGGDTYAAPVAANDSGSGKKSRSSSGGGGGGGSTDAPPALPPFPGGGFGTPNVYPTLPMTDIRRRTLEALSGPFGQNVGQFRTPPGGWREDMAPMFTTGAFGGLGQSAPAQTQPVGPSSFMAGAPAPAPSAPAPAPAAMPPMPSMPTMSSAPSPAGMFGQSAPAAAPAATPAPAPNAAMPPDQLPPLPSFNRPGVMSPNSIGMNRMPGYFAPGTMPRLPETQGRQSAPPLPPSLAKRFGF